MLFTADAWPGIADGSITITFRTWARPQAKTGGRYRVAGMLIEATDVREVATASITGDEARRAGERSLDALIARLGQPAPDTVWRVEFRYLGDDDRLVRGANDELSDEGFAELRRKLDRLDRAGAWTRETLRLIHRYPGVVSTALARHAGQERPQFKLNVRRLKELGLTISLGTGYQLSPLGEAVLARL
jgi:hypothetical protein